MQHNLSTFVLPKRRSIRSSGCKKQSDVVILIDEKTYPLEKIHAGGFEFHNERFEEGDWCHAEIVFMSERKSISALIEIAMIDRENICHCFFKSITDDNYQIFKTHCDAAV